MQEILLLMAVALLIFGPKRLPEIGRTLGKAMGEFRRATTDLKRTLEYEADLEERKPQSSRRLGAAEVEPAAPAEPASSTSSASSGAPIAEEPATSTKVVD
jgi:sec-independent protein translocase protein TatB